tara:strand:+ start:1199 stop:2512 length:1314 start_codon:yes stop_codon:yes gene_type:complete
MLFKTKMFRIAVIGAGASGLSTAYELQKKGFIVDIYEKEEALGGLAGAVTLSKGRIDSFYHHLFKSDKYILNFLKENNMQSKVKFRKTITGHIWDNNYYDISNIPSLWKSKLLTNWGLVRLLLGGAVIKYIPSSEKLNNSLVYKINDNLFGKEASNKIWNPLLNYKFGKFAKLMPYSWLKTRIQDRTIELGYIPNGFESIYDFLEKKINSSNGTIYKNYSVEEVKLEETSKKIIINNKKYDRIVLTTPPSINKKILRNLSYNAKPIKYLGALCGIIEFNKRPIPSYWIGIADTSNRNRYHYKDFLAAISYAELDEDWNKDGEPTWPLYLAAYCTKKQYQKLSSKEWENKLIKAALELNSLCGLELINEENIINIRVTFADYAQPILSPKENLHPNPESALNCYFANMHNIFPNDRGQNRSFYLGKFVSNQIYKDLHS